jgi:hypothetical protein
MAYTPDTMLGATVLKAAGLVAADTNHSAVLVGHGPFAIRAAWTANEIASNDELYIVVVEANTLAATTTWTQIGVLLVTGATEVIGGVADGAATGAVKQGFINPYDYQIRLATYVNGALASGFNYSADLFPIENLAY